jgi:Zn-finger nucleic acid-binding protein
MGHPPMQPFPRYELVSADPFLFCGRCYGFWAEGDALARGVADAGYVHPALDAAVAPRRCKKCFGHLKPNNECAKCGEAPDVYRCPACSKPMERLEQAGVHLDRCNPCNGTWFDTGEIARVYRLAPVQGLAASTVDEHALDGEPPAWMHAAWILARVFLPFV